MSSRKLTLVKISSDLISKKSDNVQFIGESSIELRDYVNGELKKVGYTLAQVMIEKMTFIFQNEELFVVAPAVEHTSSGTQAFTPYITSD